MAMELVGEAFLSSFLSVLMDRLTSWEVVDFFRGRKLNEKLLGKLERTFNLVSWMLEEAEGQDTADQHTKKWMEDVKEVVYEADDLLDEVAYEARRSVCEGDSPGTPNRKRKLYNFINHSRNGSELETKLKDILETLDHLRKDPRLGQMKGIRKRESTKLERRTTSLVDESIIFGRGADKEAIITLLLSENDASSPDVLRVIAIVGMGGIGKTTLSQLVYGDDRVKARFHPLGWVSVSGETDVFKVTRNVLKEFAPGLQGIDDMTPNQLHNRLQKKLQEKRFLLVLDDVWDERHASWETLQKPLNSGARGSMVIVTTRSQRVASVIGTVKTYNLRLLDEEHCWSLFVYCALKHGNFNENPELETICRQKVAKCKGLPEAAHALGSLLSTERDQRKWESKLESNAWDLEGNNTLPTLRLSYHHLPSVVKRCFAYCAIFPKAYKFTKEELIQLWMAEGLLVQHGGMKKMEDYGEEYFDCLVSRSFFQPLSECNSTSFVMHDLLHDLAKSISGEFCFRIEGDISRIPTKTRHLSYAPTVYNSFEAFEGIREARRLRTFLPIHLTRWEKDRYIDGGVVQHLTTLERLRVLGLSWFHNVNVFPGSTGILKHLRYVDASKTCITRLPDAVENLSNVQILILEGCQYLEELPDSIGKMKYLEHLNLGGTAIKQLPDSISSLLCLHTLILCGCHNLVKLQSLVRSSNLCHLDISGTRLLQMPPQFGYLANLRKLTDFITGSQSWSRIAELGKLQKLEGELRIWNLQLVANAQDAIKADLKNKRHLKKLELRWEGHTDDPDLERDIPISLQQCERDILEGLRPPTSVHAIDISNYGGTTFPNWLGHEPFSNMVSLIMSNCYNCNELPPLGQLQSLEILKFEKMYQCEIWRAGDGDFPHLLELHIIECPNLREALPRTLPSLTTLKIIGCDRINASLPLAPKLLHVRLKNNSCNVIMKSDEHYHRLDVLKVESWDSLIERIRQMGIPFTRRAEINIHACNPLDQFPIQRFPNLGKLKIHGCSYMDFPLPHNDRSWSQLQSCNCSNMTSLSAWGLPPKVASLSVMDCNMLIANRLQWNLQQQLPCLSHLVIHGYKDDMESFPEETLLPSTLTSLVFSGFEKLQSLNTAGFQQLSSLQKLEIRDCPKLQNLAGGEGLPSTLTSLITINLKNLLSLNSIAHSLQRLPCLQELEIANCPKLQPVPEEGMPSTITSLKISHFYNLMSLDFTGLRQLSCLKKLEVSECPELEFLSEYALSSSVESLVLWKNPNLQWVHDWKHLSSLAELEISDCPEITKRCEWEGEDWQEISRLNTIKINGRSLK